MSLPVPRTAVPGRARTRVRRLAAAAFCGVVAATLGPPSAASAGAPLQESSQRIVVPECTASDGGVDASLGVFWTDGNAFDSTLTIREAGEVVAYEQYEATEAEWNGSVLSGHMTLIGPGGEEVGTATFVLDLARTGEATTETTRWRDGNVSVRETVVRQPLVARDATIAVTLGGRSFDFTPPGCTGTNATTLTVSSQPDTVVRREPPDLRAECQAVNSDGDLLLADLSSFDGPAVSLVVVPADEAGTVTFGTTAVEFSGPPQPVQGTVELFAVVDEELVPAGTALVDLASAKVGQTRTTLVYQGGRDRLATTSYRLDGTVTLDGTAPFLITDCQGSVTTAMDRTSSPAGPRSGGPAPANDAPEAAADLVLGAPGVNVQTGGAAVPLEAPTECAIPDDTGSLTPGRSVWFRVTGTGGPVVLDPSGSTYNTVLSVYELQEGALVELACVDDVFGTGATTQPPLTVPTVEGATYYVQAAGFAQQFGRLRLAASAG